MVRLTTTTTSETHIHIHIIRETPVLSKKIASDLTDKLYGVRCGSRERSVALGFGYVFGRVFFDVPGILTTILRKRIRTGDRQLSLRESNPGLLRVGYILRKSRLVGMFIWLIDAQLGAHHGVDAVRGAIGQRDWHVGGGLLLGCSEVLSVEFLG